MLKQRQRAMLQPRRGPEQLAGAVECTAATRTPHLALAAAAAASLATARPVLAAHQRRPRWDVWHEGCWLCMWLLLHAVCMGKSRDSCQGLCILFEFPMYVVFADNAVQLYWPPLLHPTDPQVDRNRAGDELH